MKKAALKLTFLFLVLCMAFTACAPKEKGPDTDAPGDALQSGIDFEALANEAVITDTDVTFTDARGETVTIKKNPERVVSIYNSYTGLWYEAGGTVIGRLESESELPEAAKDPAIVTVGATAASVSTELLLGAEPDLVLLRAANGDGLFGQLEQNGIAYIAMEYNGFADYLKWLKIFTALSGTEELYETQGVALLRDIDAIIARIPDEENPTVMLMFGTASSVKAYLSNTAVGEMIAQLKAVNIADSWENTTATSVEMNIEYLITADPDFILVQCMGDADQVAAYIGETYGKEAWWNALAAVQGDRVFYLDRSLFHYKPNGRYATAYEELARIIYPDLFA